MACHEGNLSLTGVSVNTVRGGKWCCKGDTDKTNLERHIQKDLVRRWDLS